MTRTFVIPLSDYPDYQILLTVFRGSRNPPKIALHGPGVDAVFELPAPDPDDIVPLFPARNWALREFVFGHVDRAWSRWLAL